MTTGKLDHLRFANESWLPGVRQCGAKLSASPHRIADRPRLSRLSIVKETTEYPANGSSSFEPRRREYGQASRLISTSQLNASLRFHIWPINLVVYQEPSEALRPGKSHLGECFTLRCLQRFSRPNVATRRYPWQDNRYTRGSFNPVLSY